MASGLYSDTGYRFRKNTFDRRGYWWPWYETNPLTFYDIDHYNTDTYQVSDAQGFIARMVFSIETEQLRHVRQVYSFGDWVGNIGGIIELYYRVVLLFFGGYLAFNSQLEIMSSLYHIEVQKELEPTQKLVRKLSNITASKKVAHEAAREPGENPADLID